MRTGSLSAILVSCLMFTSGHTDMVLTSVIPIFTLKRESAGIEDVRQSSFTVVISCNFALYVLNLLLVCVS